MTKQKNDYFGVRLDKRIARPVLVFVTLSEVRKSTRKKFRRNRKVRESKSERERGKILKYIPKTLAVIISLGDNIEWSLLSRSLRLPSRSSRSTIDSRMNLQKVIFLRSFFIWLIQWTPSYKKLATKFVPRKTDYLRFHFILESISWVNPLFQSFISINNFLKDV